MTGTSLLSLTFRIIFQLWYFKFSLLIDNKSKLFVNHFVVPAAFAFCEPLALVWPAFFKKLSNGVDELVLLDYFSHTFGMRVWILLLKKKMVSVTSTERRAWPTRALFSFEWTLFTCKIPGSHSKWIYHLLPSGPWETSGQMLSWLCWQEGNFLCFITVAIPSNYFFFVMDVPFNIDFKRVFFLRE